MPDWRSRLFVIVPPRVEVRLRGSQFLVALGFEPRVRISVRDRRPSRSRPAVAPFVSAARFVRDRENVEGQTFARVFLVAREERPEPKEKFSEVSATLGFPRVDSGLFVVLCFKVSPL